VKFSLSFRLAAKQRLIFGRLAAILLTVTVTAFVFWKPIQVRVHGLLDPFSFNGDALQHIAPLWHVHAPAQAVHDYTSRYYLQAILPPLFKQVYAILTVWTTPPQASKVVTVILSVVFILVSTKTTHRLAGVAAACLTFFMATGGVIKNFYFMGGIQRGFGFCLAAFALHFVCSGRLLPLAALAVIAAMLYPAAAVSILCILGITILLPSDYRGSLKSWGVLSRLGVLVLCVAVVALAVTPQILGGRAYGERLSINAESEFAEWGPHGRYTPGDRGVPVNPWRKVLSGTVAGLSAKRQEKERQGKDKQEINKHSRENDTTSQELRNLESASPSATEESLAIIALSLIGGTLVLIRRRGHLSSEALRCCGYIAGIAMSFLAAKTLFPLLYIPSRYIALGTTALTPVVFPALWSTLACTAVPKRYARAASFATIMLGAAILMSLSWHTLAPKKLPTASGNRALFAFIRTLPADAVVASWPRGIINMVPLFTAKSVLVFEEGHQIFHRDFLEELRRRTRAIINAYAATDMGPIQQLRQSYNVTHILVNKRHLTQVPDYFAPFVHEIRAARKKIDIKQLALTELSRTKAVFKNNDYVVVDIREL